MMMMMMMMNNNHPHQALLTQRSDEAKIQHQTLTPVLTLYLRITIIISRKSHRNNNIHIIQQMRN